MSECSVNCSVCIRIFAKDPNEVEYGDTHKDTATNPANPTVVVGEREGCQKHIEACFEDDSAQETAIVHDMLLIQHNSDHEEAEENIPSHDDYVFKGEIMHSELIPNVEEGHTSKSDG